MEMSTIDDCLPFSVREKYYFLNRFCKGLLLQFTHGLTNLLKTDSTTMENHFIAHLKKTLAFHSTK